jgi:hypothetical protein
MLHPKEKWIEIPIIYFPNNSLSQQMPQRIIHTTPFAKTAFHWKNYIT